MNVKAKKSGAGLLIFICWLVYLTSYLGKVNFSANIIQITDFYRISKAEAGAVPMFFFFAYGIGQVVNGILCKRYNIKITIFIGLFLSALVNYIIAVSTEFTIIKWLWLVNGFALSLLWPTLIRQLAEALPQKDLAKSSIIMGTTVAGGTLITYGLSSVYAYISRFKLSFYTAAFAGAAVAVTWLLLYSGAVGAAKAKKDEDEALIVQNADEAEAKTETATPVNYGVIYLTTGILCLCAIGVNLIKDGLTTWVPLILKEEALLPDYMSILLTLFLPILAIFGNAFALFVHKRIFDYVIHCLAIFAVTACCIFIVLGSLPMRTVLFMLVGLVSANFFVASLNSLITSIYPMFMRNYLNSGRSAGVLNGFCYVGSAISSYGLGYVADQSGWATVFWLLIGVCAVVCGTCIAYIPVRRSFKS